MQPVKVREDISKFSDTATVTVVVVSMSSVQVASINPKRKAIRLYNDGNKSVFLSTKSPAETSTNVFIEVPSSGSFEFLPVNYRGPLYGIRLVGTGPLIVTEFT